MKLSRIDLIVLNGNEGLHYKEDKDMYQYIVQIGQHPAIQYYSCSPFVFKDEEAAKRAAERHCEQKNIKWSKQHIHIRKGRD